MMGRKEEKKTLLGYVPAVAVLPLVVPQPHNQTQPMWKAWNFSHFIPFSQICGELENSERLTVMQLYCKWLMLTLNNK